MSSPWTLMVAAPAGAQITAEPEGWIAEGSQQRFETARIGDPGVPLAVDHRGVPGPRVALSACTSGAARNRLKREMYEVSATFWVGASSPRGHGGALCAEVADGKIADPFDAQDVALVASQFSWSSVQDFSDNLRSVAHVHHGGLSGPADSGLSATVATLDPALDQRVLEEVDGAIAAVLAMPAEGQHSREAVLDPARSDEIEAAQQALRTQADTVGGEVMPLVLGS
ncbi:MAG: hypothetical protein JXX28_02800 [Deltaproteobacteria bacterium]|nr:hypothetical protein [Deltaproteobacteria bacterium]